MFIVEGFKEDEIGFFIIYGFNGCDKCVNGYKGWVGIYEVVKIMDFILRIIMEDGNVIEIVDVVCEVGFNDFCLSGLKKVKVMDNMNFFMKKENYIIFIFVKIVLMVKIIFFCLLF